MEAAASTFRDALETAAESLLHARYNSNMLDFLCQGMTTVQGLLADIPADSPLDEMPILLDAAQEASKLVIGHTRRFDIRTYYHVDYVRREVGWAVAACIAFAGGL